MSGSLLLLLIGCWVEPGSQVPESRFLYGVSGNLVLRRGEQGKACESDSQWSEPDEDGVRRLRLSARWSLVENARTGERYVLLKERERFALPACCVAGEDMQ